LRVFKVFNLTGNSNVQLLALVSDSYCLIYCNNYDANYLENIHNELPFERLKDFIFAGDKQTIENLLNLQGLPFKVEKHLIIYKCDKLNPQFKVSSGKMRLANLSESDYLTELSVEFTDEYDGDKENIIDMRNAVHSEIIDNTLYVWEDGKICTIAVEMNRMITFRKKDYLTGK
jgi:hypothetical protein